MDFIVVLVLIVLEKGNKMYLAVEIAAPPAFINVLVVTVKGLAAAMDLITVFVVTASDILEAMAMVQEGTDFINVLVVTVKGLVEVLQATHSTVARTALLAATTRIPQALRQLGAVQIHT